MRCIAGAAAFGLLTSQAALALDVMEAIGAEKCVRGARTTYEIEFLAPENATLEARAKVVAKGTTDTLATVALALDGKDCTDGRCGLQAKKGQSYRLSASTAVRAPTRASSFSEALARFPWQDHRHAPQRGCRSASAVN